MRWEAERYDWRSLKALGTAAHVPAALERLAAATTDDEARTAYWQIDNVVIVQGDLYEAATPTAACAVVALIDASPAGRPWVLELLVQLAKGAADPDDPIARTLAARCLAEVRKGVALYLHFLERGTLLERLTCVDLLMLCAEDDRALANQVESHLQRLRAALEDDRSQKFIDNCIADLRRI